MKATAASSAIEVLEQEICADALENKGGNDVMPGPAKESKPEEMDTRNDSSRRTSKSLESISLECKEPMSIPFSTSPEIDAKLEGPLLRDSVGVDVVDFHEESINHRKLSTSSALLPSSHSPKLYPSSP